MSVRDRPSGKPLRSWLRWLALVAWITILLGALKVTGAVLWTLSVPAVSDLETIGPVEGTKLYDEDDRLLVDLQAERRIYVPLSRIPQVLRDAIIAVEDSRFYSHVGVDPTGIGRAVYQNFRRGRIVEGGSTITQQLAKVLFLTRDRSLDRKLKEAVLALRLERRYSKDRILEMYLNQVYFGHGTYGVEAAARTYFGKSVTDLSLPEAALLAGLPRAPALYSPFNHPDAARRRRAHVLNRMLEVGALKPIDAKRALATDLGLLPPERRGTTGQYFVQYVRGLLSETYGEDMVFKGGLRVYTTLSPPHAGPGRAIAGRGARGAGVAEPARRGDTATPASPGAPRGGFGHDRARDRLHQGDGGRLRLLPRRVQPGRSGQAPARLGLQALRLSRRPRGRAHAGHADRGQSGDLPGGAKRETVGAGQLRRKVSRPHHPAAGDRGVGERGNGQAPGADRPPADRGGGAPAGDPKPARRGPLPCPRDL